jgi:hypothetical protein
VAEIKSIFEPFQLADYLKTARQTEPFDPDDTDDEDPEMVDLASSFSTVFGSIFVTNRISSF